MRSHSIGAVLAASLIVTGCLGGNGNGPGGSPGGTADGRGAFDRLAAAIRPVLGATGDFTMQVMRRGCGDNPFIGRSPVEVLALTTTYTAIATTGYTDGIARAQSALGLQKVQNQAMISDLDALKGGLGLDAAFTSFRMIEVNSDAADQLVVDLEARTTAAPLPEPVRAELAEANRSLHIGNHFQVDAAVGAVLLAAYVADSLQQGGGRELTRIMLAEFNQGGGRQLVDSLTSSPATLMNMVLNLGNAYSLHRTLNDVTDFGEEEAAARMLGLEVDLEALEAVALANARSLRSRYPEELAYRPTGTIVKSLVVNALERRGVSNILTAPALSMVMTFCGGAFGDTTMVATADPAAPLDQPQVLVAQQALIDLGYLEGRADGVAGQLTSGAVTRFQRDHGLPADGRLTQGLLGELRLAQGRAVEPGGGRQALEPAAAGAPPAAFNTAPDDACVTSADNAFVSRFKMLAVTVQQQLNDTLGSDYSVDCP